MGKSSTKPQPPNPFQSLHSVSTKRNFLDENFYWGKKEGKEKDVVQAEAVVEHFCERGGPHAKHTLPRGTGALPHPYTARQH